MSVSAANAQPADEQARKDEARALAERGDGELEAKKYAEAEATFKRAIELVDAPTLHVRLARALVGLGRFVEAAAAYTRVVETDLGPKPRDAFVEAVAQAKEELAAVKKRIAIVHVGAPPGSGPPRVDGREVHANGDVEVDPGKHEITADGAVPRSIEVAEGERVSVDLVAEGVPFPFRTTSTPVFILAGLGLFSLGLGAGYGIDAIAQKSDLDAACGANGVCPPEFRSLHDAYVTSGIVSTTAIVVGGTALLTGVIVFAVGKPLRHGAPAPDGAEAPVAISIGPAGASARLTW